MSVNVAINGSQKLKIFRTLIANHIRSHLHYKKEV
jgi:hypothetical protein